MQNRRDSQRVVGRKEIYNEEKRQTEVKKKENIRCENI